MSREALEVILAIGFAILGLGLFIRRNSLNKSKYYRLLIIVLTVLFIAFAVYLAIRSFNNYA